jgi:hypothetical protein
LHQTPLGDVISVDDDPSGVFDLAEEVEGEVQPEGFDEDGVEEGKGEELGDVEGWGFAIRRRDESREDFGADGGEEGGRADDFVEGPCGDGDRVGDQAG